jgi:hypothetical protein
MNLRTPHTQANYDTYRKTVTASTPCFLCNHEDIIYGVWKLVKILYPYDLIAKPGTHFMLCPKRHVAEEYDLNEHEQVERDTIIRYDLSKAFSGILLNFGQARTHKSHLHYHLWINKD